MASVKLLDAKDAAKAAKILSETYRNAKYYLNFKTPTDLLVAAIISAQTRDETVNKITPQIFAKYKSAKDYVAAGEKKIAEQIKSVSLAGNKAKNIVETCKIIGEKYGGKVPGTVEELVELPVIGKKTANTILINAYHKVEGIPVDTWVIKLSHRLGFSTNKNPDKIEEDLKKTIPKEYWGKFAYVLKTHGKAICGSVPVCSKCPINDICPKNGVKKKI
jgi:endonuclease-3